MENNSRITRKIWKLTRISLHEIYVRHNWLCRCLRLLRHYMLCMCKVTSLYCWSVKLLRHFLLKILKRYYFILYCKIPKFTTSYKYVVDVCITTSSNVVDVCSTTSSNVVDAVTPAARLTKRPVTTSTRGTPNCTTPWRTFTWTTSTPCPRTWLPVCRASAWLLPPSFVEMCIMALNDGGILTTF